jgi:hypothetical protein
METLQADRERVAEPSGAPAISTEEGALHGAPSAGDWTAKDLLTLRARWVFSSWSVLVEVDPATLGSRLLVAWLVERGLIVRDARRCALTDAGVSELVRLTRAWRGGSGRPLTRRV